MLETLIFYLYCFLYRSPGIATVSSAHTLTKVRPIVQDWDFISGLGCFLSQGTCLKLVHFLVIGEWGPQFLKAFFISYHMALYSFMAVCAFRANKKSLFNLLRWSFIQHNAFRDVIVWSLFSIFHLWEASQIYLHSSGGDDTRFSSEQECCGPIENSVYHRHFTVYSQSLHHSLVSEAFKWKKICIKKWL